jgi:hypothetical protein
MKKKWGKDKARIVRSTLEDRVANPVSPKHHQSQVGMVELFILLSLSHFYKYHTISEYCHCQYVRFFDLIIMLGICPHQIPP